MSAGEITISAVAIVVCMQPQSMSRADSGSNIGSRSHTPEIQDPIGQIPPNPDSEQAERGSLLRPQSSGEEESTTVGGKVVSLSNGASEGEENSLRAIPEESLGVGSEAGEGKRAELFG